MVIAGFAGFTGIDSFSAFGGVAQLCKYKSAALNTSTCAITDFNR
jgi:hypothetical protein